MIILHDLETISCPWLSYSIRQGFIQLVPGLGKGQTALQSTRTMRVITERDEDPINATGCRVLVEGRSGVQVL